MYEVAIYELKAAEYVGQDPTSSNLIFKPALPTKSAICLLAFSVKTSEAKANADFGFRTYSVAVKTNQGQFHAQSMFSTWAASNRFTDWPLDPALFIPPSGFTIYLQNSSTVSFDGKWYLVYLHKQK
jgi:hypothetical protein